MPLDRSTLAGVLDNAYQNLNSVQDAINTLHRQFMSICNETQREAFNPDSLLPVHPVSGQSVPMTAVPIKCELWITYYATEDELLERLLQTVVAKAVAETVRESLQALALSVQAVAGEGGALPASWQSGDGSPTEPMQSSRWPDGSTGGYGEMSPNTPASWAAAAGSSPFEAPLQGNRASSNGRRPLNPKAGKTNVKQPRIRTKPSCLGCIKRKGLCDRGQPCMACAMRNADCHYMTDDDLVAAILSRSQGSTRRHDPRYSLANGAARCVSPGSGLDTGTRDGGGGGGGGRGSRK